VSKAGWRVLRLDGKDCENVVNHRQVYPGLLTYEGYHELIDQGENSASAYSFARGAYPVESASFNVIPHYLLDQQRGTFLWVDKPVAVGSFDTALEYGGDAAMFTAAKYGEAFAFQPESGPVRRFEIPRWALQIDQQFAVQKQNGILMGEDIKSICRALDIRSEWFGMDKTGNGTVLYDWLTLNFGSDAHGIEWGNKATELTILDEGTQPAIELYDDVISEMYFAFSHWTQFGYVAFNPIMNTARLFNQLANRRYRRISKVKRQIESKRDFKKRNMGESPDESDSCVMNLHVVRLNSRPDQAAQMEPTLKEQVEDYLGKEGKIDFIESGSAADRFTFVYPEEKY
jgi:hypothetical protein